MSKRILRINSLLQQEISKILLKELETPEECLITVTKVEATSDLKEAKIWISIFPFKKRKKILTNLRKNKGKMQFLLNRKLSMHPLPKIDFKIDDDEEEANKIEEILNKLDEK